MDVFDSAVRTKGDLAGVFEYEVEDGPQSDTAYFYLYEPDGSIISAIHVRSGVWSITEADIAVKWDKDERTGARYGGRHRQDFNVEIPWS
ncbi:hypothetical protein [Mesorhizobium sp. B2-6-2]|uniref:hypothetical protein n=1 Tax=Mesorhizobium sp. B2-6-2 TaxID=2589915 RepID=UPI0011271AEC|nr:hypothetical protein [Mesorhizobium sp. B2-6-2]TPJ74809.1 hypothetical protein FJ419_23225 [Mesorhizobium sp. B2-6-2]